MYFYCRLLMSGLVGRMEVTKPPQYSCTPCSSAPSPSLRMSNPAGIIDMSEVSVVIIIFVLIVLPARCSLLSQRALVSLHYDILKELFMKSCTTHYSIFPSCLTFQKLD